MLSSGLEFTGKIKTRAMIACEKCGREFQRNRKADLQRHMRIHTNEKPFICPFPGCEKAFRQSSALKNHSNFHQRDTSYTCQQCQMNFFDKPTYNRHMKEKHELEYVYACSQPGCGKHFKRKPVFKTHMQERHGMIYGDVEALSHRVSAAPYLKQGAGSRSLYPDSSALPKLTDAIEHVYSPHNSPNTYGQAGVRTSSPASYAYNTSTVPLRDPYAKPSQDMYAAQMYTPDAFSPVDYEHYSPAAAAADLWIPAGYGTPSETCYYNGQIIPTQSMNYLTAPTMIISVPTGAGPANMAYNGYPAGNGLGSAGSLTPQSSPHSSRSSSSSPVSSLSSLHAHSRPAAPSFPSFIQSPGQY